MEGPREPGGLGGSGTGPDDSVRSTGGRDLFPPPTGASGGAQMYNGSSIGTESHTRICIFHVRGFCKIDSCNLNVNVAARIKPY